MHQVSKVRASQQDESKFYITFAKDMLQLRADNPADRALWLQALNEHAEYNAALAQGVPAAQHGVPASAVSDAAADLAAEMVQAVEAAAGAEASLALKAQLQRLMQMCAGPAQPRRQTLPSLERAFPSTFTHEQHNLDKRGAWETAKRGLARSRACALARPGTTAAAPRSATSAAP